MEKSSEVNKKIKEYLVKIKKDKKLFSAILLGVLGLLLIMTSGASDTDVTDEQQNESGYVNISDMEKKLELFIEKINGAGESEVMITFESTQEKVYAKNKKEVSKENWDEYSGEYIIVDMGSVEDGLVEYIIYPKVRGVAVVCTGADNPVVRERIISSVSALFSLSTNRISVATMTQ